MQRADASLMGNFARDYRARGFGTSSLAGTTARHGDSGGRYAGMGWLDHFDYLRWISLLVGTVGPDAGIVLHGISMGGAAALLLGGSPDLPPQVRAVISDCSFSSAYAEFAYHLRARHLPARLILPLASQMCRSSPGTASPRPARSAPSPAPLFPSCSSTAEPTPTTPPPWPANSTLPSLTPTCGSSPAPTTLCSYFNPGAYRNRVEQFLRRLPHA